MNHFVPDFEMDEDYSIPASSARSRKSAMPDDEITELVWQEGRLVMQSQIQRPQKKTRYDAVIPEQAVTPAAPPPQQPDNQPQLFMQEDEMASWLQYPLAEDDSFCADLLYNVSNNVQPNKNHPPPISAAPPRRTELQNFLHFSRLNNNNNNSSSNNNRARYGSPAAAPPSSVVRETTVVDSNDTPLVGPDSRVMASNNNASPGISMSGGGGGGGVAATGTATASSGKDAVTCEISLTSPGGGSTSGSLSADQVTAEKSPPPPPVEDRKRKGGRDPDDAECQSEDVEFESPTAKKQTRESTSTKRSRAAEVHNLSERRRRDRINEKMRSLQELIPRCNKSDKASMLDEAIEYLKSLQLQVQMMSMGCGMVPMIFPGVQPYMPMGIGMGMGMGMGVEMGMTRPIMPYGNVLAGSTIPTAAQMRPRFPVPAYQMQTMLPNDPNRVQATNTSEHMSNSLVTQTQNQSREPNFADPYQQYFTPQQMQMQMQLQQSISSLQNQAMAQPSSSMGPENQECHQ